jgi:hypothetical protein
LRRSSKATARKNEWHRRNGLGKEKGERGKEKGERRKGEWEKVNKIKIK